MKKGEKEKKKKREKGRRNNRKMRKKKKIRDFQRQQLEKMKVKGRKEGGLRIFFLALRAAR